MAWHVGQLSGSGRARWGALAIAAALCLGTAAEAACPSPVPLEPGGTLSAIASRCGVALPALLAANPSIRDPNRVPAGTPIALPGADREAASPEAPGATVYQVRPGDTLQRIADQEGVSLSALLEANPDLTNPDQLTIGTELALPGAAAPTAQRQEGSGLYRVRPGDTMAVIAKRLKVRVPDLLAANPSVDPRFLPVGARLRLPGEALPPPVEDQEGPLLTVEPGRAAPGDAVSLALTGLPPGARVLVAGGHPGRSYLFLARARADEEGRLDLDLRLPAWAEERFRFAVEVPGRRAKLLSEPIAVTAPTPKTAEPAPTPPVKPASRRGG